MKGLKMFVIAFLFMVPISQAQKAGLTITLNPTINNSITNIVNNTYYNISGGLSPHAPWLYECTGEMCWNTTAGDERYIQSEIDPQVGVLTAGKWCSSDGSVINCTSDAPSIGSESDPYWTSNFTACGPTQKLYFSGSSLTCSGDIDTDTWASNSSNYYNKSQVDMNITSANSSVANYCVGIDTATNTSVVSWVNGQGFLIIESDPEWSANYSIIYMKSNPYGFYNSSNFLIADYYLKNNPYGYYNATTIPAYLTAESDPQIDVLASGKFCTSNGTVINCTADVPGSDLSNYYTKTQGNATYLKYSEWVNCTGGQFVNALGSCASPSGSGNITGDGAIGMIAVWRTTGYIGINSTSYYTSAQVDTLDTNTNASMKGYVDGKFYLASNPSDYISSYTETDPYWSANYSGYNKANWDNAHLYVNNGTFYLATNPTGYITATTDTNTNTTMAAYVDGKIANENTTMKAYVDGRDTATNTSATQYAQQLDTATNNTMAAYCQGIDTSTNTSLKAWVTGQNYYASSDPYGFYNSSDFLIADYYLKNNPYSYYNSTTIPGYYPYSNPYSYYNATTLPADDDTPDSDSEVPNDITIYGSQNITLTGTANITVSSAIYIGGATGWKIYVNGTGYLIAEDV